MNELSINTSQNVNINFNPASLGERILAFAIDMLIKIGYVYILLSLLELINFNFTYFDSWESGTIEFFIFSPVIFYSLIIESLLGGQTFGKKIMKIRVIKIDGYQATFTDYFVRWAFRIIEVVMLMGAVAVASIIFNGKNQRLGGIVSGTAVISLKNKFALNLNFLKDLQEYKPQFQQVLRFTDNDMRIISQSFQKAVQDHDVQLEKKLVDKIENVLKIKNPYENRQQFIRTIINDYQYLTQ